MHLVYLQSFWLFSELLVSSWVTDVKSNMKLKRVYIQQTPLRILKHLKTTLIITPATFKTRTDQHRLYDGNNATPIYQSHECSSSSNWHWASFACLLFMLITISRCILYTFSLPILLLCRQASSIGTRRSEWSIWF